MPCVVGTVLESHSLWEWTVKWVVNFIESQTCIWSPIADKYLEGKLRSSLQRELTEPESAERKAHSTNEAWSGCGLARVLPRFRALRANSCYTMQCLFRSGLVCHRLLLCYTTSHVKAYQPCAGGRFGDEVGMQDVL